jgi:hypothetical protein
MELVIGDLTTIPRPSPDRLGLVVVDLEGFIPGNILRILGFGEIPKYPRAIVVTRPGICFSQTSRTRRAVTFRTLLSQPVDLTLDVEIAGGAVYHFTTERVVVVSNFRITEAGDRRVTIAGDARVVQ